MGRIFTVLATGGGAVGNVGASPRIVPSLYAAQFDGHYVRPLRDPPVGAAGVGGSVWTRLAPMPLDSGVATKFVLAPMTFGPSDIAAFASGEGQHELLRVRVAQARAWELSPDIVVFGLGPADLAVECAPAVHALSDIEAMLRELDVTAPLVPTGLGAPPDCAAGLDDLRDRLVDALGDRGIAGPDAACGGESAVNEDAGNAQGLPTDAGLLAMAETWFEWVANWAAIEPTCMAAAE